MFFLEPVRNIDHNNDPTFLITRVCEMEPGLVIEPVEWGRPLVKPKYKAFNPMRIFSYICTNILYIP
jgi:hypothetical protein